MHTGTLIMMDLGKFTWEGQDRTQSTFGSICKAHLAPLLKVVITTTRIAWNAATPSRPVSKLASKIKVVILLLTRLQTMACLEL